MLKKIFLLLLPVILVACQQDDESAIVGPDINGITVQDGRLVFTDELLYANKLGELERLTPTEQIQWSSQFKFNPLMKVLDGVKAPETFMIENRMAHLGTGHLMVLNKGRLIQFGDDVVFFDNDTKYYMNVKDFNELSDKNDIVKSESTAKIAIMSLGTATEEDSNNNGRVETNGFTAWNKGDIGYGGWQSDDFYFVGYRKKFINEWWARTEQIGTAQSCRGDVQMKSTLYLRAKLDEKRKKNCCLGEGPWYESVDPKKVWFDLTWMDVYFDYGAHPGSSCAYQDLSSGPYSGSYVTYRPQSPHYGPVLFYITDTGTFWGEWHATFDLKKWHGRMNGYIGNEYTQTGLILWYDMRGYNW